MTQFVVLCGGLGTRMVAVTGGGQKCLVPVGGRPFLAHVVDALRCGAGDQVLLLAGHRAADIEAFATGWRDAPFGVDTVRQSRPNGTIAALREAAGLLSDEFVLVLGDVLPPRRTGPWRDLRAVLDTSGALGVMATAPAEASGDPGNVEADGPRITRYGAGRDAPFIDRGCRLLRRVCLERQTGDTDRDFFGGLAASGRLAGCLIDEPIVEVGSPDRWEHAQRVLTQVGRQS
ncbi:NTP transferase domain-containing protein [Streptomyces sp. NPDC048751]|uniref:NTP transferase domain-containing protein n=1 Tax=Streptomyces sp. NPDC048751 TaxID=3365591 RepID=UPI00370F8726